jgi:hypothetical protein
LEPVGNGRDERGEKGVQELQEFRSLRQTALGLIFNIGSEEPLFLAILQRVPARTPGANPYRKS